MHKNNTEDIDQHFIAVHVFQFAQACNKGFACDGSDHQDFAAIGRVVNLYQELDGASTALISQLAKLRSHTVQAQARKLAKEGTVVLDKVWAAVECPLMTRMTAHHDEIEKHIGAIDIKRRVGDVIAAAPEQWETRATETHNRNEVEDATECTS